MGRCLGCQTHQSGLAVCSGCRVATYCSTTCSSSDWEGHSYICGLIAYRERQVLARQAESLGARREAGQTGEEYSVAERREPREIGMSQKKDDETCGEGTEAELSPAESQEARREAGQTGGEDSVTERSEPREIGMSKKENEICGEGKQADQSPAESQGPKKEAGHSVGKDGVADRSKSSEIGVSLKNDIKKHFEEINAMVNNNKIKDDSGNKDHPTGSFTSHKKGVKVKAPRVELKVERKVGEKSKRLKMDVKVGTSVEKVIQNYADKFKLNAADLQLYDSKKRLKGTDVFVNTGNVIHIEVKEINNKK